MTYCGCSLQTMSCARRISFIRWVLQIRDWLNYSLTAFNLLMEQFTHNFVAINEQNHAQKWSWVPAWPILLTTAVGNEVAVFVPFFLVCLALKPCSPGWWWRGNDGFVKTGVLHAQHISFFFLDALHLLERTQSRDHKKRKTAVWNINVQVWIVRLLTVCQVCM